MTARPSVVTDGTSANLNLFNAMRQYLIDELSFLERDNLDSFLKRNLKPGPIEGTHWLELPPELLAPPQQEHPACGPFYFAVILENLEKNELRAEFLVRSSHNMHCSCIAWASPAQRQFLLDWIDKMLQEEFISV
ncbi:MAG: hypothetical protein ACTFAL_06245 [Candidatus Electronema sp. V4]|uniref:hypothetical protein n=1 Tax=Candidatus Electronema sp. V4 TaxID=3454756 RepID=UPI0040558440